jgi:hypothetical protein
MICAVFERSTPPPSSVETEKIEKKGGSLIVHCIAVVMDGVAVI